MCYVKYERDIVTKHKVELVGWPASIKFANPSEIGTVEDIRNLRQVLKVGECKWIVQTRGQQAAYAVMLERKLAAGELVVRKRKQRSDKGKQRVLKGGKKATLGPSGKRAKKHTGGKKPEESEDDSENDDDHKKSTQPPKKKRKYGAKGNARIEKKLPPAPKSKVFISDTDDEDDDDE